MHISRILRLSALAGSLLFISPFAFAATQTVVSPAALEKVVLQLQSQMEQIANGVPKKLAAQNAANQQAISNLQKQTQAQIAHLQSEIVQLQGQMLKQIAQVQKEVQQVAQLKK